MLKHRVFGNVYNISSGLKVSKNKILKTDNFIQYQLISKARTIKFHIILAFCNGKKIVRIAPFNQSNCEKASPYYQSVEDEKLRKRNDKYVYDVQSMS